MHILYDSIHCYKCGHAHLGMPKVIPNIESAISQD